MPRPERMPAAGTKTRQDPAPAVPRSPEEDLPAFRYVGKPAPVRDARAKATGAAVYTADIKKRGMLHGKILYSTVPHGIVQSIDTAEALRVEGVVAVSTCFDAPQTVYNSGLRFIGHDMKPDEQIFHRRVRYVGDRVAAVAAETERAAAEALRKIRVEYQELPAVYDMEEALAPDAPSLHEGGNRLAEFVTDGGDAPAAIGAAEVVHTGEYRVPAVHHYAMEPHVVLADWDGENLELWTSAQNIFAFRIIVSQVLGIPVNRIRVVKPTVGGGFGSKVEAVLEPVAAWMAVRTGRPVRFEMTRAECMVSTRTRHEARIRVRTGWSRTGRLQGIEYTVCANAGAYATATLNVLRGMSAVGMNLYRTPHVRFRGIAVYTNSPVGGAMRGYGTPQLMTALETHVSEAAGILGMDPLALRMENLVGPGEENPLGRPLGNARVRDCLEEGARRIGWEEGAPPPVSPAGRRALGMACSVHVNGVYPKHLDATSIRMTLHEDGSLTLYTGTQDIGEGITTTLLQIAGEVLGVDPSGIQLVESDTRTTSFDLGTFASRGTWVSGRCAKLVAGMLRDEILSAAAAAAGADPGLMELLPEGRVLAVESGRELSFQEVALHVQQTRLAGEISVSRTYYSEANYGSYAAHLADVEVDARTGEVTVHRFLAVHDIGRAINPLMLEGQVEGGVQMGLGYALREKLEMDRATGRITNAHSRKYPLLRAPDMPPIEIAFVEEGEEPGPFGAKAIGEIATIPVAAAVLSAINAACGTRLRELPATPEAIRAALAEQE